MDSSFSLVIGGEAGQGVATMGEALGRALTRRGYALHVTQSYESRIRGGHNTYAVRTGNSVPHAPVERIDLLVALDAATPQIHADAIAAGAILVSDDTLPPIGPAHWRVPMKDIAAGVYRNTAMLGVIGGLIGLAADDVWESLRPLFRGKGEDVLRQNEDALDKGYAWGEGQPRILPSLPQPVLPPESRLALTGHDALVLGALSAGLKFFAFYPMSPATSIAQSVADAAPLMGVVMEQCEDEIAAVNMAIGASFAGAPAMVSTSGGGFALMTEGVSLTAMTETPLVIVVAMRPGPATGLPTRTEQADLDHVLHAGHGEFPRAILTPGTPEQCFRAGRHALALARRSQGPVFILTDQYLADSLRDCEPFDLSPPAAEPLFVSDNPAYRRYAVTPDGISPRAVPGLGKALVVADSDEHEEDGHLTENLDTRLAMQNKRMAKHRLLRDEALPPEYSGPETPEILLVCWGSTVGAVQEAARRLRGEGHGVGVYHFQQVWPLRSDDIALRFTAARRVIMVESNQTGQMARLLLARADARVHGSIRRYDGLPMTAAYILDHLHAVMA